MATFEDVFNRTIGEEGGYTPGKNDPGGETKFGISKRSYPYLDIKALTRDKAKEIYKRDFWNHLQADQLYDGVAYQLFDFAFNSGMGTAIRAFQRAIGVADDGNFGPMSRAAARATSETDQIMRLNAERLDFLRKLSTWEHFGRGWAGRIAANLRYGAIDS